MAVISTDFPLRADLSAAVDAAWAHVAAPGAVWTGEQRVTIAAQARRATTCALCRERKQALSPYTVPGEHAAGVGLPAPAVDAVHRMATDPARLTETWYGSTIDAGVSEAAYAELVGVMAALVAVDTLAKALSAAPPTLPVASPGEPSASIAEEARVHSAWLPTVPPESASNGLAALYRDRLTNRWGFVANVHRSVTLVPAEQIMLTTLLEAMYIPMRLMGGGEAPRALTTPQLELLAATVSAVNGCFY